MESYNKVNIDSRNNIQKWVLCFILFVPFFQPRIIQQYSVLVSIYKILSYLSISYALMIVLVFMTKKRLSFFSPYVYLVAIYELWVLFSCYYNGTFSVNGAISALSIILLVVLTEYYIKVDMKIFLSVISFYSVFLILINFISLFLIKSSQYTDASGNIIYFWSTRNHLASLFFLAIVSSTLVLHTTNRHYRLNRIKYFLAIALIIVSEILVQSSTTIVGLVCFLLMILIIPRLKFTYRPFFFISVGFFLHFAIVILRVQEIFQWIIVQFLGKDLSFTGRTDIWDLALLNISQHLYIGIGKSNTLVMNFSKTGVSAHNQLLELTMQNGIIGLILFIILIYYVIAQVNKEKKNLADYIVFSAIFAYIIMMITEVVSPYEPWFIIMGIASNLDRLNACHIQRMIKIRIGNTNIHL